MSSCVCLCVHKCMYVCVHKKEGYFRIMIIMRMYCKRWEFHFNQSINLFFFHCMVCTLQLWYWHFLNSLCRRVEMFQSIFLHLNISVVLFVLPESGWSRQNTPRPRLPVFRAGKNYFCASQNALKMAALRTFRIHPRTTWECLHRMKWQVNCKKTGGSQTKKSADYLKEENEKLLSTSWKTFNEGNETKKITLLLLAGEGELK